MSNYNIFVDLGMSGSKCCFMDDTYFYGYTCPPKVAKITKFDIETLIGNQQMGGGLESGAYLQEGESMYALGDEAEDRVSLTTKQLRKSALARIRILGCIGEMAYQFKLNRISVNLGVALPFEEYLSDQRDLIKDLSEPQVFTYRGWPIELNCTNIQVLPEGAGLVQWRKISLKAQRMQRTKQTYVVVMIGHRDLSFLVFKDGKPPTGVHSSSEKLGYYEFLESVSKGICSPDSNAFYEAMLNGDDSITLMHSPNKKPYPLKERREECLANYWSNVQHRLSDKFAALDLRSYEILVGGGTAMTLLHPYLSEYLPSLPGATVNWLPELTEEMASTLKGVNPGIDLMRFADCYGGVKWLWLRSSSMEKAETGAVA